MKRKIFLLLVLVIICTGIPPSVTAADRDSVPIYIGSKKFPVNGKIVNNVMYLPAVALSNTLRVPLKIGWSTKYHTVILNGIAMTTNLYYSKENLLFPANAVERLLKVKVSWDSSRKAIIISRNGKSPTAANPEKPIAPSEEKKHKTQVEQPRKHSRIFIPQTEKNEIFSVTVSDVTFETSIKDYYKPNKGNIFVVVYLSQTNISPELQVYTGKFSLIDNSNRAFDPIEGLSNFWLQVLKPYGTNFGYLVFEIPENADPVNFTLHSLEGRHPVTIFLPQGWTD